MCAWLYAVRAVAQGEELVWDYRLDVKSSKEAYAVWACACGAETCRGTMVNPEKLRGRKAPGKARAVHAAGDAATEP